MNNRKAVRVMLLALVVFGVFFTLNLIQNRDAQRRDVCIRQFLAIEGAKEQFGLEHNGQSPATILDLVPVYMPAVPICPANGNYEIGNLQTGAVCSVAAHAWEWK